MERQQPEATKDALPKARLIPIEALGLPRRTDQLANPFDQSVECRWRQSLQLGQCGRVKLHAVAHCLSDQPGSTCSAGTNSSARSSRVACSACSKPGSEYATARSLQRCNTSRSC